MAGLDWQVVVVTAAALGAAFVLVRPLIGRSARQDGGAACPRCAAGQACATRPGPIAAVPPRGAPGRANS